MPEHGQKTLAQSRLFSNVSHTRNISCFAGDFANRHETKIRNPRLRTSYPGIELTSLGTAGNDEVTAYSTTKFLLLF